MFVNLKSVITFRVFADLINMLAGSLQLRESNRKYFEKFPNIENLTPLSSEKARAFPPKMRC